MSKHIAGVLAAGLSLMGHLAVIEYGGADKGAYRLETVVPDRVLTVALHTKHQENEPVEEAPPAEKVLSVDATRASVAVIGGAESERLFPAFYKIHYYDTKELSRKPFVTVDIPRDFALTVPGVPDNAAVLLLLINEYGDVDKVIVENSLLPQTAQSTLENTLSAMRFFPGEINGVPVKSRMKIQIRLAEEKSAAKGSH
jgi:hypothetical protein